jgi:YVTN family beta-propeller protein
VLALFTGTSHADLNYEYYEGNWDLLPDFDTLTPVATGSVPSIDISVRQRNDQFGFRFSGTVTAATADTYTFYTNSDDGSRLWIDGTLVVDNDGLHGPAEKNGQIALTTGSHSIIVTFFEKGGGEVLDVNWSSTTNGKQPIPTDGILGVPTNASVKGQWGPVIAWPHVAVSGANLPDGRVLTWSGSERDTWPTTEQTYSGTWDPGSGEFVEIFHDSHNMFCSHLAMAEDGRVFVNGGRNQTNSPWTSLFDYRDNSWTQIENMASGGRWYPTTVALTDGDMFTAIGTATNQRNPDRWDPVSGWRVQNGIDFNDMVLDPYSGTHNENRWWPLLHVAPNGKLFHSGPTPQMHWINTTGTGSFQQVGSEFTDWYHKHGTTIMYEEGKLLTAGGWISGTNIASSNQAFTVDLNGPAPVIAAIQPMAHARKYHNGVMLPNGEVLVVGGNTSGRKFSDDGAILAPEIWNPITGAWREGAPMMIPRNYHSIALLLTDGRVLGAGSGYNSNSVPASTHQDGQVYSPPYLFNSDGSLAARPGINSGPGLVEVGDTFNVTTSDAIAYFSLIKMSSTTHGMNTDVRYLRPQFVNAGTNSYDITLHSNPNVATPGYWMLFAVNTAGVPSVAEVLRITTIDTRQDNVALAGTATQSSTLASGFDLAASNAIDGDLTGTDESGSLAYTGSDPNSWWEIDLGQVQSIETIRLWNRSDCCASRLGDFHVLVSDLPFDSQDLSETLLQVGVLDLPFPGTAGQQTNIAVNTSGRYVRVQLSNQDFLQLAEVQIFGSPAPRPPTPLQIENGILTNVGSDWQTVTLANSYSDMVVVASVQYGPGALPAVTRVRSAAVNQFDIRVQNPGDAVLSAYTVNYVVIDAGVYDTGEIKLEAVKFNSTVTDENGSWSAQSRSYQQSYANPVVVGQVMSDNDPDWSVFWASNGTTGNPPSATSLAVGKHVAEDSDITRADETIGYLVIEAGAGTVQGTAYQAGLGSDIIEGVVEAAAPYVYPLAGQYDLAVVASAGMDGTNGGWPVLWGADPLANAQLDLGVDEDQINDSERVRTTDQAGFFAMAGILTGLTMQPVATTPAATGTDAGFSIDASGPGTLTYSWNFGDGDGDTPFSTDSNATHTYSSQGRYTVIVTVRDGDGNEAQDSFTQLVHQPLTASTPSVSSSVIENAALGQVWNVNPDNDTVSVIDIAMQSLIAEIGVGDAPRGLALAPDGRIWVTNKESASISIIDANSLLVVDTLDLDTGSRPHGLAMGPANAYITLEAAGEVVVLDAVSGAELTRASVGPRPRHISLDTNAMTLFVSRFVTPMLPDEDTAAPVVDDGLNIYGGQVLILDAATLGVIDTVILRHANQSISEHGGPGIPNYLGPAVISPDGTSAWVPSKQDNILAGALRGGPGLTFDQTVRAINSRIDIASASEDIAARTDHDNASIASHAAFGRYGVHLFTALEGNREIAVSDVYTSSEILRFNVGRAPQGVAVSADGNTLFVHNFMDRSIGMYDISALSDGSPVAVTEIATVTSIGSETLSASVLNGKQLFYDARDDRLAAQNYMSCASCHNEGGQDGRIWDFTGVGEGLRNTISLEGRAGTAHGFLHWSANFDEVQDFEAQIRNFAGGLGLMDNADFFSGTRSQPLGDTKAGFSTDLDDLAAYLASLNTIPASPNRDADGSLSASAELGAAVFESEDCSSCHSLPQLTDSSDGNGLHDVGTLTDNSGTRLGGPLPLSGLDTPTLVGAWYTRPYLHDGSAATLQSAIAAHQDVTLTAAELDQLAALISELNNGNELAPVTTGPVARWRHRDRCGLELANGHPCKYLHRDGGSCLGAIRRQLGSGGDPGAQHQRQQPAGWQRHCADLR